MGPTMHIQWVGYPDIVYPLEINVHENGEPITTFQLATLLLERTQDWFNVSNLSALHSLDIRHPQTKMD